MGELVIDLIGGNCPVQAEGTVDGFPFYFRARGRRWSLSVGEPTFWEIYQGYDGADDSPYAAGWMTVDEARAFIDKGVWWFRLAQRALEGL